MRQLNAKDMQDAGLLVAKMVAAGCQPVAVIVVGVDHATSELAAGTLWLTKTPPDTEAREYIAACAKGSIMEPVANQEVGK